MSVDQVDLSNCDREPIHVPGAIQPHGVLIAFREPELIILQASENLADLLGVPMTEVLGAQLASIFDAASETGVRDALGHEPLDEANPLRLTVAGIVYDGLIHRHQGVTILELELNLGAAWDQGSLPSLRSAVVHLQAAETFADLCLAALQEIRRLTAFERVMIYRFDEQGHGVVEAEITTHEDSYLGLRYPASDIPRQARELYLRNWIRSIPDARYSPVSVLPALRPDTGAPLDLSFSVLRSVSPIHLEYLANMGVRAAMSVSLVVHGRLWGLISCLNHTAPRHLPYAVRSNCELLGRVTSLRLSALEDAEIASRREARQPTLRILADAMRAGDDVLEALLARPTESLSLLAAAGLAAVGKDEILTAGRTPPREVVTAIADLIGARGAPGIFSSSSLAVDAPELSAWKELASGVLSFALPGGTPRRILWFRPEILQTVNWSGDPRKPVEQDSGKLHPRRSFALWREEVRLCSEPWSAANLEAADDLRRHAVELDLEKQVLREQQAVRARDDLVAVVSHDLKNPLHVIQMQVAILRATVLELGEDRAQRHRASVDRIQRSVDRMNALIHDLLDLAKIEADRFALHCRLEPVSEMMHETTALLRPLADAKHVDLVQEESPSLLIEVDRERIFQVLSNLVGNAIKFTPEGGRVVLRAAAHDDAVLFAVSDTGPGIAVHDVPNLFNRYFQAPTKTRSGAGLGLFIAKGIVEAHGGRIWVELPSSGGATFKFTLPRNAVR